MIRCPEAYNPPVVSTMAFCINDVQLRSRTRKGKQKGAACAPSQSPPRNANDGVGIRLARTAPRLEAVEHRLV
jgi:hypothetical protein